MEWCGSKRRAIGSKRGAIGSKHGAIGSKCGAIGSKCGAKWIRIWSKVEKRILFLFDSKLESCLEASTFKYRITEISEKGLLRK